MPTKTNIKTNRFDTTKWIVTWVLIALGVVGNAMYSNQYLLYRVLGLAILAILASLIVIQTTKGRSFLVMLQEARNEIRKVVWPNRQETIQTTLIVVVVVLVVALLLWGLDSLLSWAVSSFIG